LPQKSNVTHIIKRGVAKDLENGDVVANVEMLELRRPTRRTRRSHPVFGYLDLPAAAKLKLTGKEWEVLTQILAATNMETGEARITGAEIARATGMHQPAVARLLAGLRERSIVIPVGVSIQRVNTHLFYRGGLTEWDDATSQEEDEPQWVK
jgi:hypothetical protein